MAIITDRHLVLHIEELVDQAIYLLQPKIVKYPPMPPRSVPVTPFDMQIMELTETAIRITTLLREVQETLNALQDARTAYQAAMQTAQQ